jgi:hypothetical protein
MNDAVELGTMTSGPTLGPMAPQLAVQLAPKGSPPMYLAHALGATHTERERDASACVRRLQVRPAPRDREERFRVYKEAPGFRDTFRGQGRNGSS